MKQKKAILFFLMFFLFASVSAISITANPQNYFMESKNFSLNFQLYDTDGLVLDNSSANCNILIFDNENNNLVNQNLSYNGYFFYEVNDFSKGEYSYILNCNDGTNGATKNDNFKITITGITPLSDTINTYPILFLFIGLWLLGGIYFIITPFKYSLKEIAEKQGLILLKVLAGVVSTGALWLLYSLAYIRVFDGSNLVLFQIPQLNSFILAFGLLQTPLIIYFVVLTFVRYLMEK